MRQRCVGGDLGEVEVEVEEEGRGAAMMGGVNVVGVWWGRVRRMSGW